MERRVFLEMSPVANERLLTEEELAEVRRRALRPASRLVPYVAIPALLLIIAMVLKENGYVSGWRSLLTFVPGLVLLLVGILQVRDLHVETQDLKSVSEESRVLTFQNLGRWPPESHFTLLGPPERIDVLFPERLVIATDNKPLKVFKPITLTLFVDAPSPPMDEEFRELNTWERSEILKSQRRYRMKVAAAAFGIAVSGYMILSCLAALLTASVPNITEAIGGPFGIWFFSADLRKALHMFRVLGRATEESRVSVWWDDGNYREYLLPGQLLWRDESGPARWRHVESE